MNVLFTTSEIASLYHLGGLGDVSRSLPIAIHSLGVDVRIAMPYHNPITASPDWKVIDEIEVLFAGKKEKVTIWDARLPGTDIPVYLFANDPYLSSPSGVAADATEKFSFFCTAVCAWLMRSSWKPEIIHLNDWHTALLPVLLKHRFHNDSFLTLLTIHNLNFQGVAGSNLMSNMHIEPSTCATLSWDNQNNDINLLMEGIIHADLVNTVSPTYAHEILTQEYGAFLDSVLNALSGKLSGILNGIDYDTWNPEKDLFLAAQYSVNTATAGKAANKVAIQEKLGLAKNNKPKLVSYIGRVDGQQKGIQLIIDALKAGVLGNEHCQFVFLGTGDTWLEDQLTELAHNHPHVSVINTFNLELSHLLYAGSDAIVVPSRYEPCGLVQISAMHYGTIPIVRKTGGLADTVIEGTTGFVFEEYSSSAFITCVQRALSALEDPTTLETLRTTCMKTDFSWQKSGRLYKQLYLKLLGKNNEILY